MSKILWKMIGVETKVNGLNEVEYTLECSYGARDVLYMLYILGSIFVINVVSIIALNDGGIISVIGAMLTLTELTVSRDFDIIISSIKPN